MLRVPVKLTVEDVKEALEYIGDEVGVEVLNSFSAVLEEGIHPYLDLAVERGLPDTMCSAQRGVVGLLEAGVVEKPDFLVNGAAGGCDHDQRDTNDNMDDDK